MRYLTGSNACSNSGSVKCGVICCGRFKPEQDRAPDLGFVARRREAPRQISVVLQFYQFRERVDLETPAARVVHQHESGTVVGADIADADVLPIAWRFAKPSFLSSSTLRNPGGRPCGARKAGRPPRQLGWGEQCGQRLGGPVAIAALGFAFGSRFASALASEAYRHVIWTPAALAVAAALTAIAWLGDDPPENCGARRALGGQRRMRRTKTTQSCLNPPWIGHIQEQMRRPSWADFAGTHRILTRPWVGKG
jgi:hypothetical protein